MGKAGTGKSTFLKYICANTKKKHVVLAPTGIAAINAGGSTLHSFFKLPFYPLLPDDPNFSLQRGRIHEFFKYTKPHRKLLEELELVIIDEISMVRADIIDAVDRILRVYSYFVGCNDKKAAPKQAENVGVGSVIPRSVPANLAVNPDKK